MKLKTILMQNFGVTNKEHYGMLWYFLEWSIKLPGAYLLQTHLRGSLIETGDLFNLAKTMLSVLHKELEYKVEEPKYKKLEAMQLTIKPNPNLQLVNKPSCISPHEVSQSLLIYPVQNLLVKNYMGEGKGA